MMKINKRYIFFCGNYKYEGKLIEISEKHFIVDDYKEGIIYIPISETIIKEVNK